MASIDQFKSLVSAKDGMARPNLFLIELPGGFPGASVRELNLLCKDVQLPGRQIMTNERRIGMKMERMAYGYAVTDISLTFHVMNDYGVKEYFEAWQNLAIDQNRFEAGYQKARDGSGYAKSVKIRQLKKGFNLPVPKKEFFDTRKIPQAIKTRLPKFGPIDLASGQLDLSYITNDDVVYICELQDAFPTTINPIQLNNELDGLVELNVQLSYTNWTSSKAFQPLQLQNFISRQIGTAIGRVFNT